MRSPCLPLRRPRSAGVELQNSGQVEAGVSEAGEGGFERSHAASLTAATATRPPSRVGVDRGTQINVEPPARRLPRLPAQVAPQAEEHRREPRVRVELVADARR